MISDHKARQLAINTEQSYIVQAPAGSGKTELLTQRVLNLLSQVQHPEEVIAITFTRKAAREMQQRIIESLQAARMQEPEEAHKKITWQLAVKVLQQDQLLEWGLLNSPHRLRVMTFDALCSMITNQMPVLSRFGSQISPTEQPLALYQEAAKSVLEGIKFDENWAPAIQVLLQHTDNKLEYLQQLLAEQLAKRDQWYRLIGEGFAERELLEQGFVEAIQLKLQQASQAISKTQKKELLELLLVTADYSEQLPKLVALKQLEEWPKSELENLAAWQAIANFCLTASAKTYRAKGQLPALKLAETKQEKDVLRQVSEKGKALFTELKQNLEFAECLHQLRNLPEIHYQESQWQVIEALIQLMQVAGAFLTLQFKKTGQVDFTEISMAAERALGEIGEPSDLALKLDYNISHILVDEFQDTSFAQYHLLEKLIAGWQHGDGRTLFIVGDPMQSIYRFREANVGLFIQARERGLADIKLEPLQLISNFRSSEKIVNWVNKSFSLIFPNQDDPVLGAVSLAKAASTISGTESEFVQFQSFFPSSEISEAQYIAQQISACLEQDSKQKIAILVRARKHALEITEQLRLNGIKFKAEQMESLQQQQIVIDLMTICRALLHPLDNIAWLALYKSPFFGLSLDDMSLISQQHSEQVSQAIYNYQEIENLSERAVEIFERQSITLQQAVEQIYQTDFSVQLEQLWLKLGGPACIEHHEDLEHAYAFFDLLSELEQQQVISDYQQIEDTLQSLYAQSELIDNCPVTLMTMHKSKGLEFDTVFLPKLDKKISHNAKSLMVWEEFPKVIPQAQINHRPASQYLIAPISQASESQSLYKLVNDFSKEKDRLESARLLYVAATRAKKRLYLTSNLQHKYDSKLEREVLTRLDRDSLMHLLLPIYATAIESQLLKIESSLSAQEVSYLPEQGWQRLQQDWSFDELDEPLADLLFEKTKATEQSVEFDWASDIAKVIGTIIHRQLELVSNEQWQLNKAAIENFAQSTKLKLQKQGYSIKAISYARKRIVEALTNCMEHDKAQWVLKKQQEARSELALTGYIDGDFKSFVIDRTFIDEDGQRWIVDYKTGAHLDQDKQSFIDSEVSRYRSQLMQYRYLMQQVDDRPIKMALYFPMMKEFVEVS